MAHTKRTKNACRTCGPRKKTLTKKRPLKVRGLTKKRSIKGGGMAGVMSIADYKKKINRDFAFL